MNELIQNLINAASLGSVYALLALGIALIFGIMRLLNFAHAELVMISAYAMFLVASVWWPVLMLTAIGIGIIGAILMERLAFRGIRDADESTLLITSFALSYLLQNVAVLVFTSRPKGLSIPPAVLSDSVEIFGTRVSVLSLVTTVVTVFLLSTLVLILRRTRIGIQMRASAEDFGMARALGVRANRVIAFAFGISGALAAVASILYVAQTGTLTPRMGLDPVIIAFVATILGGMGSLSGAVLGGYLLGALTVLLQATLPLEIRSFRDAFLYFAVVLILVLRPKGLIVVKHARGRV